MRRVVQGAHSAIIRGITILKVGIPEVSITIECIRLLGVFWNIAGFIVLKMVANQSLFVICRFNDT